MKNILTPALCLAFSLLTLGEALAGVESVVISKGFAYIQTSATSVVIDPASNNYGFGADVNGSGIASIAAPILTGPINTAALGTIHNNGRLVYSVGDGGWRWGFPNANDFGAASLATVNSIFASGTYTINVNGVNVSLLLTGDAYPNAPQLTLTGGAWTNGKYVMDAGQALTITTNAFTAYGTHADDGICILGFGPGIPKPFVEVAPYGCRWGFARQLHSAVPGSKALSVTLPAYTFQGGQEYAIGAGFSALVDVKPLAALPGSVNVASYDAFTLVTLSVTGAVAPPANGVQVNGTFAADVPNGGGALNLTFACTGTPTCIGTFTMNTKPAACSNSFSFSGSMKFTGLDLSRAGSLQGTVANSSFMDFTSLANGTCAYSTAPSSEVLAYNGNWDGTKGTLVVHAFDGQDKPFDAAGTFKSSVSAAPPVFPMTVTGTVTPTVANVSAQVQFRPQDVGTTAKVFVFALAPATSLKNAVVSQDTHTGLVARLFPKDAVAVPCVLAQLNGNGQLSGVSASTMQGVTNVLSAQGQSVTILNNIATPNVAGATFFVGYGPDAGTMIDSGVNRSAVTIPGALTCAPQPPQTGWWWNPLEGGRGFSIEAQGNNLFFAAFHYDAAGNATWNVSPGPVSLGGSLFKSDLYNVTGGQTLGGAYHAADAAKVGGITLSFSDASHGTMTWPGGTVPIERQNLVPGGLAQPPQANVPETGWWWNPNESGRGFFIEWQKGYADIAGYMYDDAGKPVWYIAVYETPNARAFTGNWWTFANGQSMGGAYRPATRTSDTFAPLTINFTGNDTAVMTLPGGRTTNLVRQRF
ncbi:MAG: hypothetical protein ABI789_06400 [Usitatibacter sp.]